jgi:hydrogenase maturation protein HypF
MIMESFVEDSITEPFAFEVCNGVIDLSQMIKEIITMGDDADTKRVIASRFLATIEEIIRYFARLYPELPIVIGGGVFQNRALMSRLYRRFGEGRFYAQQQTPINDGSIALGQLYYALHNTKGK